MGDRIPDSSLGSQETDYLKEYFACQRLSFPRDESDTTISKYLRRLSDSVQRFRDPSGTPKFMDNLVDFALSMTSTWDDLKQQIGQVGISVAPRSVRTQNRKEVSKGYTPEAAGVGERHGDAAAFSGHRRVAQPPAFGTATSSGWRSDAIRSWQAPARAGEGTAILASGRVPLDQSIAAGSNGPLEEVTTNLTHANLLVLGAQHHTVRSGSTIGSIAPTGAAALRRGVTPREWAGAGREAGSVENVGATKARLGHAHVAPQQDNAHEAGLAMTAVSPFELALEDFLMRQARLPPAGATAFDPRLTPAWAGVKLPV